MDGKRVSLPALGLVLALVFISAQAVYGGQIWEGDETAIADTPDATHLPIDPFGVDGTQSCRSGMASRTAIDQAPAVDAEVLRIEDVGIRDDRSEPDLKHDLWRALTRRDLLYVLWLLLRLGI